MKSLCCWTLSEVLQPERMPAKGQGRRVKTALTGHPYSTLHANMASSGIFHLDEERDSEHSFVLNCDLHFSKNSIPRCSTFAGLTDAVNDWDGRLLSILDTHGISFTRLLLLLLLLLRA